MKLLLQSCKGYYKELILGPTFKLAEAILELFIPLLMANIIDVGIKNGDVRYIIMHGALMLALGAIGLGCAMICQYYAAVCGQGFGRALRGRLFRHVYALSQAQCGAVGAGSLITRLTGDVNQVQTGVNMFIRLAVRAPFLAVGSVVMALVIDFKIGLIFLISTPLIVAVLYGIMRYSVPLYTAIQKRQDSLSRLVGENLEGTRVIRAFSRRADETAQFDTEADRLSEATIRVGKISAALGPITSVIVNTAIVCIIWFGGLYADTGALAQGEIIALVNYMTQTLLALIALANLIVIFTKAVASGTRVIELLRMEPDMAQPMETRLSNPCAVEQNRPRIAYENITFSYNEGGAPALENINFSVAAGQTLGIIGGTGCGKSTLMHLLLRRYDAQQGRVLVNGTDVRDYTLRDLRAKIGLVPQTAMLFGGTIRSNLQLGAPDAADAALWQALETAQSAAFVREKADGLDAQVEEGGKNLSGGQRQRLTIARALATQPEILVLDDASSALDYATDAALRAALRRETETRGMTVVLISQRAATLRATDCILVLDDGLMSGFGTHTQLLQDCAVYREICASQGLAAEAALGEEMTQS